MGLKSGSSVISEKMSKSISPNAMSSFKSAMNKSMNRKVDGRKLRGFFGHKSTVKGISN